MSRKKSAEQKLVEVVKEIGLDRVMSNLRMLELASPLDVMVATRSRPKPVKSKPEEKPE